MIKLEIPIYQPLELFDACISDLNPILVQKYTTNRHLMLDAAEDFKQCAENNSWLTLSQAIHGNPNQIILGDLSKKELVDLYSCYMPRDIYDKILVSSVKCPYCAGIGQSKNLDHYLPKSKFPIFSVHPHNLIPACRDCNTEAGASFPSIPDKLPLHPYFDKNHFFDERWIFGSISEDEKLDVKFFVNPPESWQEVDKNRVINHFSDYDLLTRFSIQVPGELHPLIEQRKGILKVLSSRDFKEHLLTVANDQTLLLNGWKRTLYFILSQSNWFCCNRF